MSEDRERVRDTEAAGSQRLLGGQTVTCQTTVVAKTDCTDRLQSGIIKKPCVIDDDLI